MRDVRYSKHEKSVEFEDLNKYEHDMRLQIQQTCIKLTKSLKLKSFNNCRCIQNLRN